MEKTPLSSQESSTSLHYRSFTTTSDESSSELTSTTSFLPIYTPSHGYVFLISGFFHFVSSFLSHGFAAVTAWAHLRHQTPLWKLNLVAAIPAQPLLLLPHLTYLQHRLPVLQPIAAVLGCGLLIFSFSFIAHHPQVSYILVTHVIGIGLGVTFLLTSMAHLSLQYFSHFHPALYMKDIFLTFCYPLGTAFGPLFYGLALDGVTLSIFWLLVTLAIIHGVAGLSLLVFQLIYYERHSFLKLLLPSENSFHAFRMCSTTRRKPMIFLWLFSQVVFGAFSFGMQINLMSYVVKFYNISFFRSALFMCSFGIGQALATLISKIFTSRRFRSYGPLVQFIMAVLMCLFCAVFLFLGRKYKGRITMHFFSTALGFVMHLGGSMAHVSGSEVMELGIDHAAILTDTAMGIGVLLNPLVGGLPMDLTQWNVDFFIVHLIGWSIYSIFQLIILLLLYSARHQ